jgi:hypothetical protein
MFQPSMPYYESEIKGSNVVENMVVNNWQCKIILYISYIFFFSKIITSRPIGGARRLDDDNKVII